MQPSWTIDGVAQLVFDASPLSSFARAGRLATLLHLSAGDECFVPRAVLEEVKAGRDRYPLLQGVIEAAWLQVVAVDEPDELRVFAEYARRLVAGGRNVGEASALAWAEVHAAVAVVDDLAARKLAQARGVALRGSIGLIHHGVTSSALSVIEGRRLLTDLRAAGAWLPPEEEYDAWALDLGLT